jgi:hypothetical protein
MRADRLSCYTVRMGKLNFIVAMVCVLGWLGIAEAQYVLVLKNGRQITVQSYREEGSMIKFGGLGGEVGLPKDQIKAILKAGQGDRSGLSISELETPPRPPAATPQKTPPAREASQRAADSTETKPTPDADEAKAYQKRLAEVTQKLETANREFFDATQGGSTASNASKEGMLSWAMDLASRIHDSQKVPGGGGDSSTPPAPPYAPVYTAKEKELSELRSQIDRLQKERDALLQEMKMKNIPAGSF